MGRADFDFADETVVVTGGSSGIGRAIALRFAGAGATVVVADLRAEPRDAGEAVPTHETIAAAGGTADYVETDCAEPDQLRAAVKLARDHGGVDVMVNNAGVFHDEPLREVGPADFRRVLSVNAGGVYFGCQAAARDMVDRGAPGAIVNTASISATMAQRGQSVYGASKAAVAMITRTAALEFAAEGIRVNGVAPGVIATEFGSAGSEETERAVAAGETTKPVPLGRAGRPEDVAGPALFLASEAAGYVTGELLHVDGGYGVT